MPRDSLAVRAAGEATTITGIRRNLEDLRDTTGGDVEWNEAVDNALATTESLWNLLNRPTKGVPDNA